MHKITSPAGHIFRSIALRQDVYLPIAAWGDRYDGGRLGPAYDVDAAPYRDVLNEESINASDYSGGVVSWDYMEITYDDRGLVTRIDCYYEDGSSSGYALLEYREQ